jgi:hypothetical protein
MEQIEIKDKSLEAKIKLVWKPTIMDVLINYPCQRALHPFEWQLAQRSKIWREYFSRCYYA